jgi:hypothetical protein
VLLWVVREADKTRLLDFHNPFLYTTIQQVMSVYEKMQPWESNAKVTVVEQSTDGRNYCTFDPLLPRNHRDVEACCSQCASYNARRRASKRGWCASCCGFLFKLFALVVLLILVARAFHVGKGNGKFRKFLDMREGSSSFPLFGGEKMQQAVCDEDRVCVKTFKFGSVDSFELRNLIEPVKLCHHDSNANNNYIQILEGSQTEDVVVEFSFNVSNPATQQLLDIAQGKSSLSFQFPSTDPRVEPTCNGDFSSWTKVYVRRGLHLNNLNIESKVYNIEIPQAIDVQVDHANVKLTAASLNANPFVDAKSAVVSATAGSTRGIFPLYDNLKITSDAGSISVDVIPQENDNKPAVLELSTQAGHINAQYPPLNTPIPAREYHTTATTLAGSVRGRYIHGKETVLRSNLGAVDAVLIPVGSGKSTLSTSTDSGMQRLYVLSPSNAGSALTSLDASHTSTNGAISVVYPPEWEGSVEAETTAGSVSMEGTGLEVTKEPLPGWGGVKMTGKKGSGEGFTRCQTTFGRVSFEIGTGKEAL